MKKTPDHENLIDDVNLWHRVTESVQPLSKHKQNYYKKTATRTMTDDHKTVPVNKPGPRHKPLSAGKKPVHTQKLQHGIAPGLDRATAKRMRRGKVALNATLDLHGMTKGEAYPALMRFIEMAYNRGHQTVLVITGKGLKKDGTVGVLRQSVPDWLNDDVFRGRVNAYAYAAPKHGGVGALYVKLRRKK